ncbi:hypothetical protein EAF00_003532 [Botryotinia globosa]|nr:hypothetical protein EAF00_003532 [Botryotinia globosa]
MEQRQSNKQGSFAATRNNKPAEVLRGPARSAARSAAITVEATQNTYFNNIGTSLLAQVVAALRKSHYTFIATMSSI